MEDLKIYTVKSNETTVMFCNAYNFFITLTPDCTKQGEFYGDDLYFRFLQIAESLNVRVESLLIERNNIGYNTIDLLAVRYGDVYELHNITNKD
jgi:hypothetical protein